MKNIKLYMLGFFICVNLIIWYAIFNESRDILTVAFLDVGQGDAIFIESPDGKQILIDGGANSKVLRQLTKVMPFYDRTIDMVILTHPDKDHIGGLPSVLESYTVDFVLESGVSSGRGVYKEFENIIEEKKIKKILARQGMKIPLCNSRETRLIVESLSETSSLENCKVYLEVLFPVDYVEINELESNTASVVLKLTYEENSFLFTGDSPKSIEKYLVENLGDYLDVDVLKLGHHGSKTSTSDLLLGFASPKYAVASVGLNNRYKHPHKEVLDLLERFEVGLFRTDESGAVIFKSDEGGNLRVRSDK